MWEAYYYTFSCNMYNPLVSELFDIAPGELYTMYNKKKLPLPLQMVCMLAKIMKIVNHP